MAAPPVPPKSPLQHRQRANTLHASTSASSTRLSPAHSISRAQAYHQPAGMDKAQRNWDREAASRGSSPVVSRAAKAEDEGVPLGTGKGKRRAVFCDVVVEDLGLRRDGEVDWPDAFDPFLSNLGTPIYSLSETSEASRIRAPRPSTPGKPPRLCNSAVRKYLRELWETENSYLQKIQSLLKDFASPLRHYSKSSGTAIIKPFEASHLFINIEDLVPLSQAFERDLGELANYLAHTSDGLPDGFGQMILSHIERMGPYRRWLQDYPQSDAIRRELEKNNSSFRQFIERTQLGVREETQQTGGFTEFLAEPFQRISRYRLMLDPIIAHLPLDSPDVEALQIAVTVLSDICSMQVDGDTRNAAILWALMQGIEDFPPALVGYEREFLDCLDVDDIIDPQLSRPTTLRTTLFLFTDKILIAKRPPASKTGRQLLGLDDTDRLVLLYKSSHLTDSQAALLGSPKKLKKGVLGYRGMVDLLDVTSADIGPHDFALSLGDNPPASSSSDRWNGRPSRRYVVSSTYAADVRRAEKEVWINRMNEAIVRAWLKEGALAGARSRREWENGGVENSTEVYWILWSKQTWDQSRGGKRAKLALQLDQYDDGETEELAAGVDGNPCVVATAVFVGAGQVRFSVKAQSDSSPSTGETIAIGRITPAIAELGLSSGLYSVPVSCPTTPGGTRTRPRSGIFSALDVFGSNSGSSLKRGHSTTSKTSAATTSSWLSNSFSASTARPSTPMSPFDGSSFGSTREDGRRKLEKKSAPDLSFGRRGGSTAGSVNSMGTRNIGRGYGSYVGDEEEALKSQSGHARSQSAYEAPALDSVRSRPSDSSSRHRRSSSLPPPKGHFNSYTSEAEDDGQEEELSASRYISATPQRRPSTRLASSYEPGFSDSTAAEQVWTSETSSLPYTADPEAMEDAPADIGEPVLPVFASGGYLPTPRRRIMGPREPGSAPPARSTASPLNLHYRSSTGPSHPFPSSGTPGPRPFEREVSPQPLQTTMPLRTQSQSRPSVTLSSHNHPQPSPSRSLATPSPARSLEDRESLEASTSSNPASKRPLTAASPRASPAKKVASLAQAFDNGGSPPMPRGPTSGHPLRTHRTASNSSTGSVRAPRSARRVVSNASTIRGMSPPPKPKIAEEMDVFNDISAASDVLMPDESALLPPVEKLRRHVHELRSKLSVDVSSKENDRIASPGRISRSPHTRNVSLKALAGATSYASTYGEARKATSALDLPALLRWTDTLSELVTSLASETSEVAPVSPVKGPSDIEFAMLEQERDLLAAELVGLKDEMTALVEKETKTRRDLDTYGSQNAQLRSAYQDIVAESDNLVESFNERIQQLVGVFQAELGNTTSSVNPVHLSHQLRSEMEARVKAEQDLREYKRTVDEELREKERWGKLLRDAGVLV